MADRIPDDVIAWAHNLAVGHNVDLNKESAKQLAAVLNGPLGRAVGSRLGKAIEARKQKLLMNSLTTPEEIAEAKGLQAEIRGIMVVLEILWETADAALYDEAV